MNDLVVAQPRRERIQVVDVIPVLDTGRFEQMQRIATVMAESGLIPDSLTLQPVYDDEGKKIRDEIAPAKTVVARCFLIVNQAVGWQLDPFSVAQCASVVHGRVCYEGKLIAAVVDQNIGVRLDYKWNDKTGDAMGVEVFGTVPGETTPRVVSGTVGQWKTERKNSPWLKQPKLQLAYRGAREWARLHAPAAMLGVYTDDELEGAAGRQERLGRPEPPMPPPPPAIEPPKAQEPPTAPVEPPASPPNPEPPPPTPEPAASQIAAATATAIAAEDFDLEGLRAALQTCDTLEEMNDVFSKMTAGLEEGETLDEAQRIINELAEPFYEEGT